MSVIMRIGFSEMLCVRSVGIGVSEGKLPSYFWQTVLAFGPFKNFGAYLLKYTASMRRKFYLSATWIVYGI
jgi:hypothetical protein